jgi:small neutral amino acid transporter SnatA (MarC family)
MEYSKNRSIYKAIRNDRISLMQNRKTIFSLGLLLFLLPVLGFPRSFQTFVEVVGGIMLMFFATRKSLEKRIVKDKRVRRRREKNPVFVESSPIENPNTISTTIQSVSEPELDEAAN